jgi:hypothetical protein
VVPRASFTFGEQIQMIIETIVGLVMNVLVADNASGQNLTRGLMMAKKFENLSKEDTKEETDQIIKDTILKQGEN